MNFCFMSVSVRRTQSLNTHSDWSSGEGYFFEWWKSLLVSHGVVGKGMVVETWTWNGELGYGQESVFMDRKAWVEEA